MQKLTRQKYNAYLAQLAQLNGVDSATEKFAVAPSVEQTIVARQQESSSFLQQVNIMGVTAQQGEKLGLGIGSTLAATVDTTANDRVPQDPTDFDSDGYNATQTNSDTAIRYAKLDAWAKFPNFQALIRDLILRRQALDRITIGWNGTSRAANSNRAANPLLQDVNIGWFQKQRAYDGGSRVMSEVVAASGVVNVGKTATLTGDYNNLDALVFDLVSNLIDPWYQEDTGLVAIMGRELLADKYFPLIQDNANTPTEANAMDMIISGKRIGGLQAVRVPFFPARSIAITRLDNLSIYYQEGSTRRTIVDNAKRDQIEDYQSVNEAYVIEDHGGMCAVENIQIPNAAGDAWA